MRIAIVFTLVVAASCTASSTDPSSSAEPPDAQSASLAADASFEERMAAWDERGIEDYTWTVEFSEPVFGPRRVWARVRDGDVVRAEIDGEQVEIAGTAAGGYPATVDAVIAQLIDEYEGADSLEVAWDDELGYPVQIDADLSDAIDDEITVTVISFES